MSIPCALFTSCSASVTAGEVVRRILAVDQLPTCGRVLEGVCSYPWHIDNKYYTADVLLCTTDNRTIGDKAFAEAVQAFIVMFDSKQKSNLDDVSMWLPYLKELKPLVQILVCEECSDDDEVSRDAAVQWCLQNEFELVELNSDSEDVSDDEDDFKETLGIARIIEALSCHSWPNLIMKENPVVRSSFFEQMMHDAASALHNSDVTQTDDGNTALDSVDVRQTHRSTTGHAVPLSTDRAPAVCEQHSNVSNDASATSSTEHHRPVDSTTSAQQIIDRLVEDAHSSSSSSQQPHNTDNDDDDHDSFEQLFEQLRLMKEAAGGLSAEDRKKYAEQVTVQFWQAIGGSADELEGLSSDSD